jgi:glycosyltransferase involved in cell wall biosynthesis
MIKTTLSVVLAIFNEALNLPRCLESVKGLADEIIVVDGSSTDDSVPLAKKYGAKIISTTNKPNFHINKQMGIESAKSDWILQLDADECLTSRLQEEIKQKIASPGKLVGFWLPRKNYFLGRFLTKGGQYPDYTLRLYKRGQGSLPAHDVHEQATVSGPTEYLKSDLLHYGTPDFSNYLLRFNRYTSLSAAEFAQKNLPVNIFYAFYFLFIKSFCQFFVIYIRHKGFVDGFPGFVFAMFSGLHHSVAYIKYWQNTLYPAC